MRIWNRLFSMLVAVALLALPLASCSDDDDDNDGGGSGFGSISAKVDGADYSGTIFSVTNINGTLTIFGTANSDGTGNQLQLTVSGATDTGTYQFTTTSLSQGRWSLASADPSDTYSTLGVNPNGSAGSVTFTTLTESRIEGTFSFTAQNNATETVEVTEGEFSADL